MKQNTFLPAMSIVLIVCSAIGVVQSFFYFVMWALFSYNPVMEWKPILFLCCGILRLPCSILEMIAGIKGIFASRNPYKAPFCEKLGVGVLVLKLVISILFSFVAEEIVLPLFILSALFPTLYVCSARQSVSTKAPRL